MNMLEGLYIVGLAAVAGYLLIGRVPSVLHGPLLSGSNFVHGIVLVGAMFALGTAEGLLERSIGFVAVALATANVVGGFVVTDRLYMLFERSKRRTPVSEKSSATADLHDQERPDRS